MPGPVAYLALLLWMPVSLTLFALMRATTAAYAGLLIAALFLPERVAFDAPLIPPLNKYTLSALCALVGVAIKDRRLLLSAKPGRGTEVLGLIAVIGMLGTAQTNRDVLSVADMTVPGMTTYDAVSAAIQVLLDLVIPFYLGRALFRSKADLRTLLSGLVLAGLAYVPLILIELRLSPQLHTWVYGYFQHSWAQTLRGDGYRPIVFMAHGLALAMFVLSSAVAAWSLKRAKLSTGALPASIGAWILFGTLAALHSLGALVYGLATIPLVWFASAARQARIATLLAALVLAYPLLRSTDTFPTHRLTDWAAQVSRERAGSLQYRFDHEDGLLEKARKRPWFGWGLWGRNRVFDKHGRDVSTTDGAWIIVLGSTGVVGFIAHFGMLVVPVFVARRQIARVRDRQAKVMLAGLSLVVALSAVDLLPNGAFSHLPVFLAGALIGLAKGLVSDPACQLQVASGASPLPASRRALRTGAG